MCLVAEHPLGLACLLLAATHAFHVGPSKAAHFSSSFLPSTADGNKRPDDKECSVDDSWSLLVLGDLHLEDEMSAHEEARDDCLNSLKRVSLLLPGAKEGTAVRERIEALKLERAGALTVSQLELLASFKKDGDLMKCCMVSLGDLGRKDIRHEPGDAGTTQCFEEARDFLDSFGIPYELVSGNHDLEGLDEFDEDFENLQAWMDCFRKPTPQFSRRIGERTLLVGLSTVRFREAPFSSHEVHIDDEQIEWFQRVVQSHPEEQGWKIIVFSHAPILGSGLRVLQNVHVVNGCAWLNHCSESRSTFIRTVLDNPQVKLWFSGHFHLSHDYEDSISTVGSCTFVQVGVVGRASTRDSRRQTRLIQGCRDRIKIHTINHHLRDEKGNANVRLDAEIDLMTGHVTRFDDEVETRRKDWFHAYVPRDEDGCCIETPNGSIANDVDAKVCWWHMSDGKGLHEGQLVEYDAETLSPLGIVVTREALNGREVLVVEKGTALVLVDETTRDVQVVHPNEDGSYWRKFQRNKRIRQEEKAREAVAKMWLDKQNRTGSGAKIHRSGKESKATKQ